MCRAGAEEVAEAHGAEVVGYRGLDRGRGPSGYWMTTNRLAVLPMDDVTRTR
jgi:hypothetical protein